MTDSDRDLLSVLRNPEYTGENRCVPCTILNVLIAAAASALVGIVSRRGGVLTFAGSLAAIALRGYLVPGTPTLTKRYLPERILAAFDKHPLEERQREEPGQSTEGEPEIIDEFERQQESAVDPERFLLEVGAVEPCKTQDDLCFTDELADTIDDRVAGLPEEPLDRALVADLYGIEPESVTVEDRSYPAVKIGRRIHKWPSEAAFAADIATHQALSELTERWTDVPQAQRIELLEVLRSFHDSCPTCGGPITMSEDTIESCCRSYEVLALNCEGCSAPLLEIDPNEIGGADGGVEP
ncbi:hypothetical protein CV102_02070 [Natronococcus pandeyae]|uniref:Uncharacterized protein n=1 Tax=Natronococcus pandeyae TaxID=2055836 RepID=A0A8J8Q747_9EURY|nr:hypothetical protein [Natronococcus pandeyae]TYL40384.1 hypothetical protein CV102_02070 [Natronococcus pandeyae]